MALRLRRITSSEGWIPQIDGLRLVAIASVLWFHSAGQVSVHAPRHLDLAPWFIALFASFHGDRGVELFFVISGFILARPFMRQHLEGGAPVKLGKFYLRRLTRLEPPYLISLLLCAVGLRYANHVPWQAIVPHWAASAVYLHNIIYQSESTLNFVTWSLEVEVQFYVLAPLLGNLYRIQPATLRRGVLIALIIATSAASYHLTNVRMQLSLLQYSHYFLTGFLLADLLRFPRQVGGKSFGWDVVGLLAWITVFRFPGNSAVYALLPLFLFPACWSAFHGRISNWVFRQPAIALTGGMCYSIYLLHMLTISAVFREIKKLQFASMTATYFTQVVLLMLCAFATGLVYFVLVERPCMDPAWPAKLWRTLSRRPVAVDDQVAAG